MTAFDLRWRAPGPVSQRFMLARGPLLCLTGPIGSGKTRTAIVKALKFAAEQAPFEDAVDGRQERVRRVKFTWVRDTYRNLWGTTLESYFKFIPKDADGSEFSGSVGTPAKHALRIRLADGTLMLPIFEFVAIGDNRVEDVLRGYEPTGFILEEADLLSEDVFKFAAGRVGRYPDMDKGGPSWAGLMLVFNSPIVDTWLHRKMMTELVEGESLFTQPPAVIRDENGQYRVNPKAENLPNLDADYYQRQLKLNASDEWYIRRMLMVEPGFRRDGKPVFAEYADHLHLASAELEPIGGRPLLLGVDAGLDPALVVAQRAPDGQWRLLDEIVSEHGTGEARFAAAVNQLLRERYPDWPAVVGWGDPSSMWGADDAAGEDAWLMAVARYTGLDFRPAPGGNKLHPRLQAVRGALSRTLDEGRPGLLVSPRCRTLRAGFAAGYRYRRVQVAHDERYVEEPEKNEYSHVQDALQYLLLGAGEYDEVAGRQDRARGGPLQTRAIDDDHPGGEYAGLQDRAVTE